MSADHKIEYVLEAYLAISPSRPHWSRVAFTAVNGWERYQKDPRLVGSNRWSFHRPEDGIEVLRELRLFPQDNYLRVTRVETLIKSDVVAGADIPTGTLVDGPGDRKAPIRDPFWGATQEDIDRIVPGHLVLDVMTRVQG